MTEKPIANSSLVRVAGNIASGIVSGLRIESDGDLKNITLLSVALARMIVAEIEAEKGGT